MSLKFRAVQGEPTEVRIEHAGKKYLLRVSISVVSVSPTGAADAKGLPVFNVEVAPVMLVAEEGEVKS